MKKTLVLPFIVLLVMFRRRHALSEICLERQVKCCAYPPERAFRQGESIFRSSFVEHVVCTELEPPVNGKMQVELK